MRLVSPLLARFAARMTSLPRFSGALAGEEGSLSGATINGAGARRVCSVGGANGVDTRRGAFLGAGPVPRVEGEPLVGVERTCLSELE